MIRSPSLILVLALAAAPPTAAQAPARVAEARRWAAEAERIEDDDPEAALRLLQRAIPLLGGAEDTALRMQALESRCWAAAAVMPDSVVAFGTRGMEDAARAGQDRAAAALRVCRGYGHESAGHVPESMADYEIGVAEGRRLGERELLASALVLRGQLSHYRGDYDHALEDLQEAYRLYTALGADRQLRPALNAIANLYADAHVAQYDRALEYYGQLLESHRRAGNVRGMSITYFNLGSTLERMGRLDEALAHYRRGQAADRRRGDADEVAVDQRAIAVVLYKLGRPAEALAVVDSALARFRATNDPAAIAHARLTRGTALRMLGRADQALADLEAARAHYVAENNQRFLEKIHEERALAFAAAGMWREAFQARGDQLALHRALAQQAGEEQSARLRVQFDAEKKEAENRALVRQSQAAARIRRLQVAVLVLSAAVIVALALLFARQWRSARLLRVTSLTDELTGLPNRRHLWRVANDQVRAARLRGTGFGVLALDVDRFKAINDTHGHDVGDAVLRRVAEVVRGSLREGDTVGRTGGEEFVAVLRGAGAASAAEVAERLRQSVEQADFTDLHPALAVTLSVGATVWQPFDTGIADTLKRADDSLYRAKTLGRNRVEMAAAAV
ncbi:MAG TPA: GGDEF domain-containing protein [Longimicrobium sp.]|nr:GGDEF domain-containing protein [Longimicrobium sp.]